jgi:hypothetical protein
VAHDRLTVVSWRQLDDLVATRRMKSSAKSTTKTKSKLHERYWEDIGMLRLLAVAINSTVVAGENPTVGSTVWLPAESVAPGR